MPHVEPTTLTTDREGREGTLSIADGFALFPWMGAIRAGATLADWHGLFFDKTINLELMRFGFAGFFQTFVGVCGPAFAVEAEIEESTEYEIPPPGTPTAGKLALAEHAMRGGFQYGIDFQLALEAEAEENLIFDKRRLFSVEAEIEIDVINLIFVILKRLLGVGEDNKSHGKGGAAEGNEMEMSTFSSNGEVEENTGTPDHNPGGHGNPHAHHEPEWGITGVGLVDLVHNPWLIPKGSRWTGEAPAAELNPSMALNFSIVPLLAEIPVLDALYAVNEALEALGGGFELGPGITLSLPTKVRLKGATISNHPFELDGAELVEEDGEEVSEYELKELEPVDPRLQPLTEHADEIGILIEHEVGFRVGLHFFAEFSVAYVFHIGFSTGDLPLFESKLPGVGNLGGPFRNRLSFVPGGGEVPFEEPSSAPKIAGYQRNQPINEWTHGRLAQYAVSFYNDEYETKLGPYTDLNPVDRFFAYAKLTDIPVPHHDDRKIVGRRIWRKFEDEDFPRLVAEIPDRTTTAFEDPVT